MTTSIIILVLTIISAFAAFWANKENSDQQNAIQRLGEKTKALGETNVALSGEVKELAKLNNKISETIDQIARENKDLTKHNIELTNQVKKLIGGVDLMAKKAAEENALTGRISFSLEGLKDSDTIVRRFGTATAVNSVKQFLEWKPAPVFITIGDQVPIKVAIEDKRLIVNLVWYDLLGNWIVEIENNFWRRNPNYTGKFNYDATGFEVIDNHGNIALSIDFKRNNEFVIQGYLSVISSDVIPIGGIKGTYPASRRDTYIEVINKMKEMEVTQLFEYTGENWIGKRRHKK